MRTSSERLALCDEIARRQDWCSGYADARKGADSPEEVLLVAHVLGPHGIGDVIAEVCDVLDLFCGALGLPGLAPAPSDTAARIAECERIFATPEWRRATGLE